jgi:hypothetical protein
LSLSGKKKVVLRIEDACGNVAMETFELIF